MALECYIIPSNSGSSQGTSTSTSGSAAGSPHIFMFPDMLGASCTAAFSKMLQHALQLLFNTHTRQLPIQLYDIHTILRSSDLDKI